MAKRGLRRVSTVAGVIVVILTLGVGPVFALTITKTATPDKIDGKSGTVTYTIVIDHCEDLVLGCFVTSITDDTHGPIVTECPPALLSSTDTYTCTFQRSLKSDTPTTITNRTTAEGFIGLAVKPFVISDTETVQIKAEPSSGSSTTSTGGTSGSVTTGQKVTVNPPKVSVPDVRRIAETAHFLDGGDIENDVNQPNVDADDIRNDVNERVP